MPMSGELKETLRFGNSQNEAFSFYSLISHEMGCVRMAKMQGVEDEDAGSVLKYMTKPKSDSKAADWLL